MCTFMHFVDRMTDHRTNWRYHKDDLHKNFQPLPTIGDEKCIFLAYGFLHKYEHFELQCM